MNHKLALAVCVTLLEVSQVYAYSGCCLLAPFVSGSLARLVSREKNLSRFEIEMYVDYRYKFKVDNIRIHDNGANPPVIDTSSSRITHLATQSSNFILNINYDPKNNLTLYYTRRGYIAFVKAMPMYTTANNFIPEVLGRGCSYILTRQADYTFLYRTKVVEIHYINSLRCEITYEREVNHFTLETPKRGISSASLAGNYLFEFDYNGNLYLYAINASSPLTDEAPLASEDSLIFSGPFVPSLRDDTRKSFITSAYCANITKSLDKILLQTTVDDIYRVRPYRTFTKFKNSYLGFQKVQIDDSEGVIEWKKVNDTYYSSDLKTQFYSWQIDPNRYTLEAVSFNDEQEPKGVAIYQNKKNYMGVLITNFVPGLNVTGSIYDFQHYIVPDDIAHWTACNKMISVYGFGYLLHEMGDNIVRTAGSLQFFDEEYIDLPVEALHVHGNEFWFFTRSSTVKIIEVGSSCSRIEMQSMEERHVRQLFQPNLKQYLLDGRYYDGQKWVPEWNHVAHSEEVERADMLPFILGGLALTGVLLALVLFCVLSRNQRNKGETIYSNQKSTTSGSKEKPESRLEKQTILQPVSNTAQQSALPLLSERPTISSVNSIESGPKVSTKPTNRTSNQVKRHADKLRKKSHKRNRKNHKGSPKK